jgi:hypothetical protein
VAGSPSLIIEDLAPHRWSKIPLPSGKRRRERARWPFFTHYLVSGSPDRSPLGRELLETADAFFWKQDDVANFLGPRV